MIGDEDFKNLEKNILEDVLRTGKSILSLEAFINFKLLFSGNKKNNFIHFFFFLHIFFFYTFFSDFKPERKNEVQTVVQKYDCSICHLPLNYTSSKDWANINQISPKELLLNWYKQNHPNRTIS